MSKYPNTSYLGGLLFGIKSLATGLKTTMREFFVPKITQQYPENRDELVMFDRFRGALVMPHNEKNEHKCVGCGICEMACPNDTIKVHSEMVEVDGRKKKMLVRYEYNLGKCMFCMLCTRACPHDAITFDQSYENAVFDRSKLVQQLNAEGSKVAEKPRPAPPARPAAAPAAKSAAEATPAAPKAEAAPAAKVAEEVAPTAPKAEDALVAKPVTETASAAPKAETAPAPSVEAPKAEVSTSPAPEVRQEPKVEDAKAEDNNNAENS